MVDTKQAMESDFLTAEVVKSSASKKIVVLEPGSFEKTDKGDRLTMMVNIDGKKKIWRPNRESVTNLQAYGFDTINWLGKVINVKVEKRGNFEAIIATPEIAGDTKISPVINYPDYS